MWITKMGFCPSTWRDILWALSDDMIRKAWPCTTRLSVNRGDRLRVSRVNHLSRIEKRVGLFKGWHIFAYSLTRYIVRQKGLRRKSHWKGKSSWLFGTWESARSARSRYQLIDWESDSNRVQVAMSLRGHTLKSGSKFGLDLNWKSGWVGPEPDLDWVSELDSRWLVLYGL